MDAMRLLREPFGLPRQLGNVLARDAHGDERMTRPTSTDEITRCPRCNAATDEEAKTMCRPGVDECPMVTVEGSWELNLATLNALAAWEPEVGNGS